MYLHTKSENPCKNERFKNATQLVLDMGLKSYLDERRGKKFAKEYFDRRKNGTDRFFNSLKLKDPDEWTLAFRANRAHRGLPMGQSGNDEAKLVKGYIEAQSHDWMTRISQYNGLIFDWRSVAISDSLRSFAFAELRNDGQLAVTVSIGLYLSLLDISLNSLLKSGFLDQPYELSFVSTSDSSVFDVDQRYFDYRSAKGDTLTEVGAKCSDGAELWGLLQTAPESIETIYDVDLLANCALGWVIAHEVAHFQLGHLDHLKIMGVSPNVHSDIEQLKEHPRQLRFSMELQADREASKALFSMMFPHEHFFWLFADKASGSDVPSLNNRARLIGTVGTIATIALDVGHRTEGTSEHYPSPKTRMLNHTMNVLVSAYHQLNTSIQISNPYFGLWLCSGILADAELGYQAVIEDDIFVEGEPLFDDETSYGIYGLAITLRRAGILSLDQTDHSFHIDLETISIMQDLAGSSNGSMWAGSYLDKLLKRISGDARGLSTLPDDISQLFREVMAQFQLSERNIKTKWSFAVKEVVETIPNGRFGGPEFDERPRPNLDQLRKTVIHMKRFPPYIT